MLKSLTLALFTTAVAWPAFAGADEDAVQALLMSTFDKPEARLVVELVVVSGNHAIADWSQTSSGGRALLRRGPHEWVLILCSGDGIKTTDALRQAGVPQPDATALATALADAERTVPAERLALFATFEGTVRMGEGAHADH
jgi:hypothetical protein